MSSVKLTLSRRNLETLLNKLDRIKAGSTSKCKLIKSDILHPTHPLEGTDHVYVLAVEDEDYYIDRSPGFVFPGDEKERS